MIGFYIRCNTGLKWVNPIHASGLSLYPLKTKESDQRQEMGY